jgi:hypothetical protein
MPREIAGAHDQGVGFELLEIIQRLEGISIPYGVETERPQVKRGEFRYIIVFYD